MLWIRYYYYFHLMDKNLNVNDIKNKQTNKKLAQIVNN